MSKICFVFNQASHYRENIYKKIDSAFDCDIFFGDQSVSTVKSLDVGELLHFKAFCKRHFIGSRLYWMSGIIKLAFKPYRTYLCTGEVTCISFYLLWFLIKMQPHKKLVLWGHGAYGKEGRARFFLTRLMMWFCDVYLTYGEYGKKVLVHSGISAQKIEVIHNSLDYESQLEILKNICASSIYSDFFQNDLPNLVFIGRLTTQKKLDQIINAMAILRDRGVLLNLTFLGDGDIRDELQLLASKKGLSKNINFYGACYDEVAIANYLYNADLCVSPGNIGLTAMHSLMYGCPAITHGDFKWQMPEFEAIVEGLTGSFFDRDDINSLADKIEAWLKYSQDNRDLIRDSCFAEIDKNWNPNNQIELLKRIL